MVFFPVHILPLVSKTQSKLRKEEDPIGSHLSPKASLTCSKKYIRAPSHHLFLEKRTNMGSSPGCIFSPWSQQSCIHHLLQLCPTWVPRLLGLRRKTIRVFMRDLEFHNAQGNCNITEDETETHTHRHTHTNWQMLCPSGHYQFWYWISTAYLLLTKC